MSDERKEFKVGDTVRWRDRSDVWSRHVEWGRVTAVTGSQTLTVRGFNQKERKFRRGKYGHTCELVPQQEIEKRRWEGRMPNTKYVYVHMPSSWRDRIEISVDRTGAAVLDEVTAELAAIRAWLGTKPEGTP